MENRAHALAAGFFVLLLGIAVGLALWWLGGQRAEHANLYVIETTRDLTGLNPQAQVRYRGIRAGKVEAIEPDRKNRRLLLVTISLDRKFAVTDKTVARLGFQGLTGIAYVQIEDDGSSERLLEGRNGEPPRIAMKPSLLDTLTEKGGDVATRLTEVAQRMSELMSAKNIDNLSRTLANAATASEGMKELPVIMAALRQMLSTKNIDRWSALLAHLEKAGGEAAPLAGEVRELVVGMTALSRRLDRVAGELGNDTLPQANALLRDLQASSRQMSRLMEIIEDSPQVFIFGRGAPAPGPGETGTEAARERGR